MKVCVYACNYVSMYVRKCIYMLHVFNSMNVCIYM